MDGGEAGVEIVVDFEQVVQVADGVMLAGVAVAEGGKGFVPFDQFVVVDVEKVEPVTAEGLGGIGGKAPQTAMPGVAGRHGAVEQVVTDAAADQHIFRMPHPQRVQGKLSAGIKLTGGDSASPSINSPGYPKASPHNHTHQSQSPAVVRHIVGAVPGCCHPERRR